MRQNNETVELEPFCSLGEDGLAKDSSLLPSHHAIMGHLASQQ
jgi:hypothetical protein